MSRAGPSQARAPRMPPVQYDASDAIEQDILDPDDLEIDNDLDDHNVPAGSSSYSNASLRQPLNPSALTSSIPGEDRRAPRDTLDESVWETLSRDLLSVWAKMKAVLYPRFTFTKWPDANDMLEAGGFNRLTSGPGNVGDWDLWGPLIFCLALSTLLSISAADAQKTDVFAGVFLLVWLGEAVVTAQIKLLGGNVSFFQSISVIGYTLFPVTIAALLSALHLPAIARVPVYLVLFLWSLAAGVSILGGSGVLRNRVGVAVYPLALFYTALICLCLFS